MTGPPSVLTGIRLASGPLLRANALSSLRSYNLEQVKRQLKQQGKSDKMLSLTQHYWQLLRLTLKIFTFHTQLRADITVSDFRLPI